MIGFFDLHCHILHGVDDGAGNFETAAKMLDMAYADGIRRICFTPHRNPYHDYGKNGSVTAAFDELHEYASAKWRDMELKLGSEIMFYSDFSEDIRDGVSRSLCGGGYVLVEFFEGVDFGELCTCAGKVVSRGYEPIIAHAERYDCIAKEPSRLLTLFDMGYLLQFNSGLFDPAVRTHKYSFGEKRRAAKIIKLLLANKLPFIVASDAHDTERRIPAVSGAYSAVCDIFGKTYADDVFFNIPSLIFYGDENAKCDR